MERSTMSDISPPSPPAPASATAHADTPGPSYIAQHSSEYVNVSTRELAGVMDAVCSLASTQASMDQRLTRGETTLEQCQTMLQQIMSHLGLSHVPTHRDEPTITAAASLDVLAAAPAATDPPPPRDLGGHTPFSRFSIPMTCLYFDWEKKLELGVSSIMFLYSFQLYQLPTNFV